MIDAIVDIILDLILEGTMERPDPGERLSHPYPVNRSDPAVFPGDRGIPFLEWYPFPKRVSNHSWISIFGWLFCFYSLKYAAGADIKSNLLADKAGFLSQQEKNTALLGHLPYGGCPNRAVFFMILPKGVKSPQNQSTWVPAYTRFQRHAWRQRRGSPCHPDGCPNLQHRGGYPGRLTRSIRPKIHRHTREGRQTPGKSPIPLRRFP